MLAGGVVTDVTTALDRLEAFKCPSCGGTREKKQTIGDMWKVYPGWMPHPDYPPPPLPTESCPDCEGIGEAVATVRQRLREQDEQIQRLTEEQLKHAKIAVERAEAAEAELQRLQEKRDKAHICPVCGGEEWTPDYDYTDDGEMRVDRCDKCEWPPPYPVTVQEWRRRTFFSEYLSDLEAFLAQEKQRAEAAEAEIQRLTADLDAARTGEMQWKEANTEAYERAVAAEARVRELENRRRSALLRLDNLGLAIASWCPHGFDSSRASDYGWADRFTKELEEARVLLADSEANDRTVLDFDRGEVRREPFDTSGTIGTVGSTPTREDSEATT